MTAPTHKLRILHISDLHERALLPWMSPERVAKIRHHARQRHRVLGRPFEEALREIRVDHSPIDLVCFTGDVADWGLPEEYARATPRIEGILQAAEVPPERLFVVPGNHDVQRLKAKDAWERMRDLAFQNPRGLSEWMAGVGAPFGASAAWRDQIVERTAAFWEWTTKTLGREELDPRENPHRRLGYRRSIPGFPFPVHVIGLDSAWLAGDDNDAKKLRLTEGQVNLLASDDEGEPLGGFRLALIHHPLSDLADGAECRRLLSETTDLLIHGHQHEPVAERHEDPDRDLRVIAAGSLYEGDYGDHWLNSFHFIDVTLSAEGRPLQYDVTFWGWSPSGHWYRTGAIYKAARDGRLSWPTPLGEARRAAAGRAGAGAGGWEASLAKFLADALDERGIRMWVQFNVPSLRADIPREDARLSREELAKIVAARIAQRGLASAKMFGSLSRVVDGPWREAVEAIQGCWSAETPGGAPDGRAPPVPPVPPPPPPILKKLEATHTSIVLDRIRQWGSILRCSSSSDEHLVFIVHGTKEQDLHLFMERIESYLGEECEPPHHVVKVERASDTTVARTAEDWERCLVRATKARDGRLEVVLPREVSQRRVLFLFSDRDGPLHSGDADAVGGLAECLRGRVRDVLATLSARRALRHSMRFVIPIEHPPAGGRVPPVIELLGQRLRSAPPLRLEPVQELRFPDWDEVRRHIEAELGPPGDEALARFQQIYTSIAMSPGRSLKALGDALHRPLYEWEERNSSR